MHAVLITAYKDVALLIRLVRRLDLRYTDWQYRNGSVPAYLDGSDLGPILGSNALFARKVSSDVSAHLLDQIDAQCFGGPSFTDTDGSYNPYPCQSRVRAFSPHPISGDSIMVAAQVALSEQPSAEKSCASL